MKKKLLIATGLLLVSVLALTACAGVTPALALTTSAWTDAPSISYETDADGCNRKEVLTYSVRINPDYRYSTLIDGNKPKLVVNSGSTVTYTLRWANNDHNKFFLDSVMTVNGVYKSDDGSYESEPFTDTITRTVSFLGSANNLAPLASETVVNINDIYSNIEDKKTVYRLGSLHYRTTTVYNDKNSNAAEATLFAYNEETGAYDTPLELIPSPDKNSTKRKTSATYKKLSKNSPYFDNNQIFYVARAMSSVADGQLAAVSAKIPSILDGAGYSKISISSTATDKKESVNKTFTYALTDSAATKVTKTGARVYFTLTSSQSGKPIAAYYSTLKTADARMYKYMIRVEQEQMLYELQTVNGEYVTSDPEIPDEENA